MNALTDFPVARYTLEFQVEQPVRLPDFAGSALRGAFGHALKRATCVTREPACSPCLLYRTCPYPAIFETPPPLEPARRIFSSIPSPFVVEPPAWGARDYASGESLSFSLVLIGPALKQLPLILLAWQRALARGIGPGEGTARLLRVGVEGSAASVYDPTQGQVRSHPQGMRAAPASVDNHVVQLQFATPLRLQRDGHVLGVQKLAPRDLLTALVRRIAYLCEFQLGCPLEADFSGLHAQSALVTGDKQLRWHDWTRYSARQKQPMTLGGAVGSWTLHGDLAPFMPFLHLGQWLHVGKNASFGLGSYRIVSAAATDSAATGGGNNAQT